MFADAKLLPPDPILGLTRLFADDPRDGKIDLGVGVYRTPDNRTPVMQAVKKAEANVIAAQETKAYVAPVGAPGFPEKIAELLFGAGHVAVKDGRVRAVQTPGGCGALRLGAELLKRNDAAGVTTGTPTWANHIPLMGAAGLKVSQVPYYDKSKSAIDFDAFLASVEKLGPKDVLLIHGACHNPTGADLSHDQIDAIADAALKQGFLVFVDMAYHGFAEGLDEDAHIVRNLAARLPEMLVSYSCSKNFGLYRERAGALFVIGRDGAHAEALLSHAVNIARGNYSMPPAHGGSIVSEILHSPALEKLWREELTEMREAVIGNRRRLVRTAAEMQLPRDLSFIEGQNGMFSMLPLSEGEVKTLRESHGVYAVGSGRINLCGVNEGNVARLCEALGAVMRG